MAGNGDNSGSNGMTERAMEEGNRTEEEAVSAPDQQYVSFSNKGCCSGISVHFLHKIIAEVIGTYFVIFAGCASVIVNLSKGTVTFPGICIVWGLAVMVMVYSVGHISGAHFNPAVSIAFATCGRLPWKQVPAYIVAQVVGSTLASVTLLLLFGGKHEHFPGTIPTGSDVQSLVIEFIISFYLMFVVCGVATDDRATGELAGLAVGATVLLKSSFRWANIRGINEPGKDSRPSNRRKPVGGNMGIHGGAYLWHCGRGMGLQPYSVHQQAPEGNHEECILSEKLEE